MDKRDENHGFIEDETELKIAARGSLLPGVLLIGELVFRAVQHHVDQACNFVVNPAVYPLAELRLPKNKKVLWPLFYSNHFVALVVDHRTRTFDVYDSFRRYARGPRREALLLVSKLLFAQRKCALKPKLRASRQQEPLSNDCGVFTINNLLANAHVPLEYNRRSLMKLVDAW